jgi:hypothetical protein
MHMTLGNTNHRISLGEPMGNSYKPWCEVAGHHLLERLAKMWLKLAINSFTFPAVMLLLPSKRLSTAPRHLFDTS